jgi:hypothetical protein
MRFDTTAYLNAAKRNMKRMDELTKERDRLVSLASVLKFANHQCSVVISCSGFSHEITMMDRSYFQKLTNQAYAPAISLLRKAVLDDAEKINLQISQLESGLGVTV